MKQIIFLSVLYSLLVGCSNEKPMSDRYELNNYWQFSQVGTDTWYPAKIPGTVHTDLLTNDLIDNPFVGTNELKLQWIGQQDWKYKTTFNVDSLLFLQSNIQLWFEGLDTYAEITLNGAHLASTNNMFRSWEFNVKSALKIGENNLEILFRSAENQSKQDSINNEYILPGEHRVYSRKAGYHFGWDWGPRFITCGIWKSVYLKSWNSHNVNDIHLTTKAITDERADIESFIEIDSKIEESCIINISDSKSRVLLKSTEVQLESKINRISVPFTIENPQLWWCNGLGEPYLYDLDIEIVTKSGEKYSKSINYGIRTIEVVTLNDSIGQSMYLKLNGVPVFMKGANYIPQHSFVTSVQKKEYENIINLAVESNMNMLRVWGGGIYEDDHFYDLCDIHGILVWQDFMFACAMYPGDRAFLDNVEIEATQQIKRLRNHASLALWCGNNEIDEGWHNWGWQKQHKISKSDSTAIWQGYQQLFQQLLPNLVSKYDSGRFYASTSPMHGWGRKESLKAGSAHYWGVWWGMEPFTTYLDKVPRFMSEFGFQAMPAKATIREMQPESANTLFSPTLQSHQKHKIGYQTILTYLEREQLIPQSVDDFIYMSQLIQAEGIGIGIEAHRRAKPQCMGTLYWQLNDCWPVTSWSGTDFYNNRKMLQFKVKELYKNIAVSMLNHNDHIELYLISDQLEPIDGILKMVAIEFNGKETNLLQMNINLEANQSKKCYSIETDKLLSKYDPKETLFETRFITKSGETFVNQKFFAPLGSLNLPKCTIQSKIDTVNGGYSIKLKSDSMATYVHVSLGENHAQFSDNHFFLMPNKEREIFCTTPLAQDSMKIDITCLNNLIIVK